MQGRGDVDDRSVQLSYVISAPLITEWVERPPPLSSGYNLLDRESQWLGSLHLCAAPRDYPALVPVTILGFHYNFFPFGISLGMAQLVSGDVQFI